MLLDEEEDAAPVPEAEAEAEEEQLRSTTVEQTDSPAAAGTPWSAAACFLVHTAPLLPGLKQGSLERPMDYKPDVCVVPWGPQGVPMGSHGIPWGPLGIQKSHFFTILGTNGVQIRAPGI